MLRWSAVFLVIAIIAAALGYGGIAADAAEIAKVSSSFSWGSSS
jgi:uncharacterized membrane protein YtjA (UPF0391 family)